MVFLTNIISFGSEIKVNINNYEYITKSNFLKDYGVLLTVFISILIFCVNRIYIKYDKKEEKNIKSQLKIIQSGILIEIQNVGEDLKEIETNKNKTPLLVTVAPSKESVKLELLYKNYSEKLNKKDIEYLDNLYYINSKFKTAKEHLMKYLSNYNKIDLLVAKNVIKIVEEEIRNLKP